MLRYLVALGAVLALVAVLPATTLAKKPPSFSRWYASEMKYEDSIIDPVKTDCGNAFGDEDQKLGECLISGLLRIWPVLNTHWLRGFTRVEKPQGAACKKALHTYFLASQKNYDAGIAYLRTHQSTAATVFTNDITTGLYKTLTARKNQTRSNATRICK